MGALVSNASPFLFPCTIEYSLICAVILFEIWKRVNAEENEAEKKGNDKQSGRTKNNAMKDRLVTTHFHFSEYRIISEKLSKMFLRIPYISIADPFGGRVVNSDNHFTVDCSNSHKGLFAGIVVSLQKVTLIYPFRGVDTCTLDNFK